MAGSKETGSIFAGKCPICGDELVVGWKQSDETKIFISDKLKVKDGQKDGDNVVRGPLVCTCGQLSAAFSTVGRAKFDWADATGEPIVSNINLH